MKTDSNYIAPQSPPKENLSHDVENQINILTEEKRKEKKLIGLFAVLLVVVLVLVVTI